MEILLGLLLNYAISLAANESSAAIHRRREAKLSKHLQKEKALHDALISRRPLREEIRAACASLVRNRRSLARNAAEDSLLNLLSDQVFQNNLLDWLRAGPIEEGNNAKRSLVRSMEESLRSSGHISDKRIH